VKRQSLEESVYEAVRDGIISGELLPGDPLVEAQLSADMGISKTPVREALIRLARDGLVVQELHRRSRVATPTAEDVRQACEVRRWVEAEIAAQAARDAPKDLIRQLESSVADSERALKRNDARRWAAAIGAFSDALVDYAGNRYAADLLERMRNLLSLIANVSQAAPGRRERSIAEHQAILGAIRDGRADAAAKATRAHLDSIEADSLQALERVSSAAS
jgi:DNA-binding GntR family transcriptional regulator